MGQWVALVALSPAGEPEPEFADFLARPKGPPPPSICAIAQDEATNQELEDDAAVGKPRMEPKPHAGRGFESCHSCHSLSAAYTSHRTLANTRLSNRPIYSAGWMRGWRRAKSSAISLNVQKLTP